MANPNYRFLSLVRQTSPPGHLIYLDGHWVQLGEPEQTEQNTPTAPEPGGASEEEASPNTPLES